MKRIFFTLTNVNWKGEGGSGDDSYIKIITFHRTMTKNRSSELQKLIRRWDSGQHSWRELSVRRHHRTSVTK